MPETGEKILNQINTQARTLDTVLETGIKVVEKPEILFAAY